MANPLDVTATTDRYYLSENERSEKKVTVWYKQGVEGDIKPQIQKMVGRIHDHYYKNYGIDLYITSKRDGNHMAGSLHYCGLAVDFGRDKQHTKERIESILGMDYDVVEYKGHYHVEYDPKPTIKLERYKG